LAIYLIECPFCGEKGKFETEFHAEKEKAEFAQKIEL